jgi:hypothetical protein
MRKTEYANRLIDNDHSQAMQQQQQGRCSAHPKIPGTPMHQAALGDMSKSAFCIVIERLYVIDKMMQTGSCTKQS